MCVLGKTVHIRGASAAPAAAASAGLAEAPVALLPAVQHVPPLPSPEVATAAPEEAPAVSGGESPSSEPEAGVPIVCVYTCILAHCGYG